MDRRTFAVLCELLRGTGRLKIDGLVSVEEQVCMFLHILAHHVKNRTIHNRFQRSGETVSRYFNSVLCAVLQLHNILLISPDPVPENCTDEKWKWFKNCLGALDGTFIQVHVPEVDKPRFRSRKGEIATNVLGVCSRDMIFTFVLPGWEGSASDSRVLRDALSRPTGLKVPTGMDVGGISEVNEQERRGGRRVWTKEEEDALLSILDEIVANGGRADCGSFKSGTVKNIETRMACAIPNCGLKAVPHIESKLKFWKKQYGIVYDMLNTSGFGWNDVRKCIEVDSDEAWKSYVQHHKQAEGFRGKHFPLYERLANIFGKDRANGKAAQTPDQQAADFDEGDNSGNEFEIPESFSPMSMNQSQSDFYGNQAVSQSSCRKRLRSKSTDPIASSMNRFSDMMKEAMEKTTEAFKEFGQILATNKANEYERIAHELQRINIRRVDQVRVMKMFVQKPEIAGIFKASDSDEDKQQFIMEILAGEFDD
ncbi:hypothetical protein LWI29_000578 [Acer saccharum]|uniref:Myb/SANT-like domain-containing protein n=1 Tax=Acer saccharum TaxID=4024 RepID=A0AA39W7Y1_ACESA|nr:hypothetical protein LWI29_022591 [Acer saccharum]KAK0606552.1 hypothetical protein LWI29_000578 [Acer saccharum]